jgi:hypothetical protein
VTDQMAGYGGHDYIALAPGRKVELEFIVFVVRRICDVSLKQCQCCPQVQTYGARLTVWTF